MVRAETNGEREAGNGGIDEGYGEREKGNGG